MIGERLGRALEVLDIRQEAGEVRITNGNRESRVLLTDGRAMGDGFGTRVEARFKANVLEVTTTVGDRARRVETFELEPGGERLVLTTSIEGGMAENLSFRMVYDLTPRESLTRSREGHPTTPNASGAEQAGETGSAEGSVADREESDWLARRPVVGRATGAVPSGRQADAAPPSADAVPREAAPRPASEDAPNSTILRLLPPMTQGQRALTGKAVIEALTLDERVVAVEFFLDDEPIARKTFPPFEAKLSLDAPPREQRVRAVAFDGDRRELGEDVLVLNRFDPPFRVRIVEITHQPAAGSGVPRAIVRAEVTVPRDAGIDRVTFYRNEEVVAESREPPFEVEVESVAASAPGAPSRGDYVRVAARLDDGRELEDVKLLSAGELSEEIEVQLVQLQVLVTDRQGVPATGLRAEEFEVTDGGRSRPVDRVEPSPKVALLLGLAVDSSGSMGPLWPETRLAAKRFLDATLGPSDRAFLVDFDSSLRLLQAPTGDRAALDRALDGLEPYGGTALYDSMLFSMMQFDREPGRRALVVITDGFDSHSRADPARAIELGKRLGIPVYVIAMTDPGGGPPPGFGGTGPARGGFPSGAAARANLRLITEPTGGRLYQVGSMQQVERAFEQIEQELRLQYVLSFYTDRPLDAAPDTEVSVRRQGLKVKSALPLESGDGR